MSWIGLSKRWEMVWLLFSGVLVVYTLRVNMSVACVDMADDLGWSEAEKGLVLSSFYWGYALGQIPASRLAQIYGAKWIFGLSVAIPSFLTLFVPMAARSSLAGALALRMMIGFFESASFPMVYHYIPVWIPIDEKTFLIPVVLSGMYMGEIIGFSLSGVLVASDLWIGGKFYGGWPSVFYVFGLVGVIWFPFWAYLAHDTPESHPGITKEELLIIRKGKHLGTLRDHDALESLVDSKDAGHSHTINVIHSDLPVDDSQLLHGAHDRAGHYSSIEANEDVVDHKERQISQISEDGHGVEFASRTPWKAIFTHPASLTLLFNAWTAGWIGFTLVSEMPSYLTDILGFNLTSAGILCVFPFLALFVSSLTFGKIFNYLQLYHSWRVRTVRQVANYISLGGSSVALVICAYLDNKYAAYAFMILALYFYGATVASLACAYSDASPNYSPILNSIGNTIGAVAGIVGPLVVAAFTEQYPGVEGWRAAFFLTVAFAIISLGMWSLWQSSEIVPAINNPKHR